MAKKRRRSAGYLAPGISPVRGPDYVIVELQQDSRIGYSTSGFAGRAETRGSVDALNEVLNAFRVNRVASQFEMKKKYIQQRITSAPPSFWRGVTEEFAHSGFVQIVPRRDKDAGPLARKIGRLEGVWKAVVAPQPVPAAVPTAGAAGSRNFERAQGYLHSPPNGIGAMTAWREHDAAGSGVTICDIEGGWNLKHEDLPRGIAHIGGELVDSLAWRNHGTAVLGEMVSRPGPEGVVGISHRARAVVQSPRINGVWNVAGAIMNAAGNLTEGDIILLELHAPGPTGRYVAMQYWDDIFSAIRVAVGRGVVVVEAAGNGGEDFDQPAFADTGLQRDSGAIVVGAGVPPTNFFDYGGGGGFARYSELGPPRSRIWFSNYGRIVNLQGWGWHVTTTGYGDAQGGEDENRWYTLRFGGTSGASPIVTGAVACIQGAAKAKRGRPLHPEKVRKILVKTGTPQQAGPNAPLSQHIGPQPDLASALLRQGY